MLLPDEVALLKRTELCGVLCGTSTALSLETACDFCCEQGLAELHGEDFRLTSLGGDVARKLIAEGVVGTVWLQRSPLDVLRGS